MDISVSQAEQRIKEEFERFVNEKCVPTLKASIGATCTNGSGALRQSVRADKLSDTSYFVGTDMPYAKYANDGRGEVLPVTRQALWWAGLKHPVARSKEFGGHHFVEDAVAKLS